MPIYEYECQDCKQIFEEWQSGYEEQELTCPVCGGTSKRLISNTSFILKGSGWYVTDYGGKTQCGDPAKPDGNGNGDKAKADGNGDKAKADIPAKPAPKGPKPKQKPVAGPAKKSAGSTT